MSKQHSTTALTKEQHAAQDARYAEGHEYDYVFIGTGNAALTCATLLANAGNKVCMLEAHDIPGGYIQSFKMGDFYFCAQLHYTWGCGPGARVNAFLKRCGLDKELSFELYNPDGYDHMVMPDGKTVKVPFGFDRLAENIEEAYPGEGKKVRAFCEVLTKIRQEFAYVPQRDVTWWDYAKTAWKVRTLLKYRKATLQDLFDEFKLSKESQAVISAGAGDFMEPPKDLSIFAFVGLFAGYNCGAFYPTKHFKGYIEGLTSFIEGHDGCHIYYETPVTKVNTNEGKVTSVETANGKTFTAKKAIICNMDPQKAAKDLIGWEKFPAKEQKKLTYEYSGSGMVIYLGLKNIDLKKLGFGGHNVWHCQQWDMNKTWQEQLEGNFENCWFFISTPTLHSDAPGTRPEGDYQIMEIATSTDFDSWRDTKTQSVGQYAKKKQALAEHLLDLVEKHYVPNLRDHIAVKVVGTPSTNEDFVMATRGNAYGARLTPTYMNANKLNAKTPFENFWWCNATSGYGGMYGTVNTGMHLYMQLTDDWFFDEKDHWSDEKLVAWSREHGATQSH